MAPSGFVVVDAERFGAYRVRYEPLGADLSAMVARHSDAGLAAIGLARRCEAMEDAEVEEWLSRVPEVAI